MALEKKFPSNFSKDIIDVFTLMTVPNTFELELLGSSSLKISFASDFDTYTKINVTDQSVSDFQQMIRNCLVYKQQELKRQKRSDKAVYVAGIKIGECLEFKVVDDDCTKENWNSKLPEMLKKIKSFLVDGRQKYESLGCGFHNGIYYFGTKLFREGASYNAVITSDKKCYLKAKEFDEIRHNFGLNYKDDFYDELY